LLGNDQVITLLTETLKNKELLREKISTLVENEEVIDLCLDKLLQDQELKKQIEFQLSKPKEYIRDPSFLLCVGSLCIFFLAAITG